MGRKNLKGTVSILKDRNSIRLRWRYQTERYSFNHSSYNKVNLLQARKTALLIEEDMSNHQFDFSLSKYIYNSPTPSTSEKNLTDYFQEWTTDYKQMDCNKHCNYRAILTMIKKWGSVDSLNILAKLNAETFCESTYNRRLTMLSSFVKWLVKKSVWNYNPLEDVCHKKFKKTFQSTRKPLTTDEIRKILAAFKNDTYCPKYSPVKHSFYYPFIYFLFKTGVRNAEAIGLRVGNIDKENKQIHIKEVLARSLNGTSSLQRIRKETKNGKERILPLTEDLAKVLFPVIKGKSKDDLVFNSPTGVAIDDNNFSSRIFKKILKDLGIEERVLYACRHTFGSRCLEAGISPLMTSFMMGNNPETLLRTYTHQIKLPDTLPSI